MSVDWPEGKQKDNFFSFMMERSTAHARLLGNIIPRLLSASTLLPVAVSVNTCDLTEEGLSLEDRLRAAMATNDSLIHKSENFKASLDSFRTSNTISNMIKSENQRIFSAFKVFTRFNSRITT